MSQRVKLGVRLLLYFGAVSVIVLLLGLVGYYGATRSVVSVNEIGMVRLPSVENLLVIKVEAENIRGTMRSLAIPGLAREVRERQYRNLLKSREIYEKAWKIYEPMPQTPRTPRQSALFRAAPGRPLPTEPPKDFLKIQVFWWNVETTIST